MLAKNLLNSKMKDWFQKSIGSELYASNLYKHLGNNLQRLGYFGAQNFFIKESSDELLHYQTLVDFINDMGDCAVIPRIDAVNDKVSSIGDALDIAYETELALLNQYKKFYEESEEVDCSIAQFLLQFIEIQRKSVGEYGDLLARYKRCGTNEAAILDFDDYLKG